MPGAVGAALAGKSYSPPDGDDLLELIIEHYEAMLEFYGAELGIRAARKHLGWYLERLPNGKPLRGHLMRLGTPGEVIAALQQGFDDAAAPVDRIAA